MLAAVLGPATPAPGPDAGSHGRPGHAGADHVAGARVANRHRPPRRPPRPRAPATPTASPTQTATATPTSTAPATPTATATAPAAPTATPPPPPRRRTSRASVAEFEFRRGRVERVRASSSQAHSLLQLESVRHFVRNRTSRSCLRQCSRTRTGPPRRPTRATRRRSGPARVGVPNFFIDKFRIPPFLLPIYQAAGMQYGVRWEILAAINEIETDYGRNLNISSAGALGWMQFMPPTWAAYGVDANGDGVKDPFNPVDAIFAAARYLKAAGADTDIRRAVFAYNHADWYVDSVLMRAQVIGGLPSDLVGSLTGLTQGRFPIHAKSTYAGQLTKKGNKVKTGNAAMVVESDDPPRHQHLLPREGPGHHRQRRPGRQGRQEQAARQVRDAAGRLRQHVHLRPPRRRRQDLPGAEGPHVAAADQGRRPQPEHESAEKDETDAKGGARRGRDRAGGTGRRRCPPRSACSRTRRGPPPAPPAATSSSLETDEPTQAAPLGFKARGLRPQGAQEGRPHHRRHDHRPPRQGHRDQWRRTCASRSAPPARAPPHRPQADPRRLEAARVDRRLPGQGQEPVLRRRRREPVDRPAAAAQQGAADPARARTTRGSRSTAAASPTSAPARSIVARWRRCSTSPATA